MSYMFRHDLSPNLVDCPPPRPVYLNFEHKRAGRAVAESSTPHGKLAAAFAVLARMGHGGHQSVLCWDAPFLLEEPDVGFVDEAAAIPLIGIMHREVQVEPDPSDALVDWFTEHQAAAERSIKAHPTTADAEEESRGEVILARPGGLRSRAWRGSGTMRRR